MTTAKKNIMRKNATKTSTKIRSATQQGTELETKCVEIREALCTAETRDTTQRYRVGVLVHDLMSQSDRYGTGAVETVAETVGCTAANLYGYASVVRCWASQAKFEEVAKACTAKRKMRLTFTHFTILAAVEADDTREALRQACLENDYSVRELKAEVARSAPKVAKPNKVRPLPPTRAAVALVAASTAWVKKLEEGLAPLATASGSMTPEQLELMLANLAQVRTLTDEAAAKVSERLAAVKAADAKAAE